MTQLEELKKLYTKTKEILIPREKKDGEEQAKITIKQLGFDDISRIDLREDASPSEQLKNIKKLVAISLGIDEKEIGGLSQGSIQEIADEIMKFSGLKQDSTFKGNNMKDIIQERRKRLLESQGGDKNVTN
jgi:hypothetical protein